MIRARPDRIPNTSILISGRGSNMAALVLASQSNNYPTRVGLVVSNKPNVKGLASATALGVPKTVIESAAFATHHAFEDELNHALEKANTDIICLAGFMEILSTCFVNKWQGRILNIHPSLLPDYKGLHTHRRVLEAGERYTGCTVHLVTPAVDDGPILGQLSVNVLPGDTPTKLAQRVNEAEHRLYPAVLATFAESLSHAL